MGPPNQRNVSWPIGNQPGNKPLGRFDVLRWSYFNVSHVFFETDFINIQELKGDRKSDIDYVINTAVNHILNKYDNKLSFVRLLNGYLKFDASRGMDYILDLIFSEVTTGKEIRKRIEICKPLGKVEIIPVPYVTENTRINIIITIDLSKKQDALNFIEHYAQNCMEKKCKTFLMVVSTITFLNIFIILYCINNYNFISNKYYIFIYDIIPVGSLVQFRFTIERQGRHLLRSKNIHINAE